MVGLAEGVGITQRAFASLDKLLQHFGKHAAEFGYKTPSEYLIGAQKLTSGGEEILTYIRPGGGKLFYNPSTNEFAILSKEGI
ncbi:MAG: hypothetical protein GXO35_06675 [Gammaproteobacteria bacterium]|nr:hypothetical protein [Gammaproteobacteria bacterium]